MIQRDPQGWASGRGAGHQHQRHLPVVILNALSLREMDGPFYTPLAMAAIAGMAFVAVHNRQRNTAIVGQGFVALQTLWIGCCWSTDRHLSLDRVQLVV